MSRAGDPSRGRRAGRGAAQLLRMPAVQGERARCARRARASGPRPTSTSPTWATGTSIEASSTPTPITSGRRSRSCRPTCASTRALVFTAHSIPLSMAERYPYEEQLRAIRTPGCCAPRAASDWALVYQSRSGRPEDPWLEPDVSDYLRAASTRQDSGRSCSARSGSSAITSRCSTTSTSRRPRCAATSDCRWRARTRSTTHPRFIDALADAVIDVAGPLSNGPAIAAGDVEGR